MHPIDETAAAVRRPDLEYPIVYNVVTWIRILTVTAALVIGPGWTYMTLYPTYAHGRMVFNPILVSADIMMMAGLAYGIAWAFTARITLYADRFEQRKPFIHRVLELDDIAGRRYTRSPGAGYPVIVPKSGRVFSIDSTSYGLDERFRRWLEKLPDLKGSASRRPVGFE